MHDLYLALMLLTLLVVIYRTCEAYNGPLFGCMAVVALNWALNTSYVLLTGETDATGAFLATDTLSLALVLLAAGRGAHGQMLVSSYAGQIIAHLLHLAGGFEDYRYWQLLTLIGFGQLVLLAAWAAIPPRRDAGSVFQ